jgi:restriction system protein
VRSFAITPPNDLYSLEAQNNHSFIYMARLLYQVEIRHSGLHEYKIVKGATPHEAEEKARSQFAKWEQKWQRLRDREHAAHTKEQKKELASQRTEEAKQAIRDIETLLSSCLMTTHAINWKDVLDKSSFPEKTPTIPEKPQIEREPTVADPEFHPRFNIFDRIFSTLRQRKVEQARKLLDLAIKSWHQHKEELTTQYREQVAAYNQQAVIGNEKAKEFRAAQKQKNEKIDALRNAYVSGQPEAIVSYCEMVLSASSRQFSENCRNELST